MVGSVVPRVKKEGEKSVNDVFNLFPILRERQNQLGRTLSGRSKRCCDSTEVDGEPGDLDVG